MEEDVLTDQDIRFTAVVYATVRGLVDHVKETGHLPEKIEAGGLHIAMRVLMERRGPNPDLTENEQLVYEAIKRDRRLPGGSVRFVPNGNDETPKTK